MNIKRIIREEMDKGYYIIEDEDGPMLIHYEDLMRQEPELYEVIKILHTSDFDKAKDLYYKYLNNPLNEEMDDMQWIEDVPNELPKQEEWVLVNDINPHSLEESKLIQNYLFKQGFIWITGRSYYLAQKIYLMVVGNRMEGRLSYYGDDPSHMEEADEVIEIFKSEGKIVYYWSYIKPNVIMESNDMEWIEDIKSNQDIAQDIADKTEIKDNRIYSSLAPLFFTYCEEQYGLTKKESMDVWDRYKKIMKSRAGNLNESNDMKWIEDVMSNQDIAQEIADKTKMDYKNERIYPPFYLGDVLTSFIAFPLMNFPSAWPTLEIYGKEQYGDDFNWDDIWDRYKKIINNRIPTQVEPDIWPGAKINESDFEWVDEDLIEVGNCFTIKDNMDEDIHIKVTEMEVPTNVEEWDNLQLKNRTHVHFGSVHGNWVLGPGLNFKLRYSEVERWIEKGDMTPTGCK